MPWLAGCGTGDAGATALLNLLTDDFEGMVSAGTRMAPADQTTRFACGAASPGTTTCAHVITTRGDQVAALQQLTDTAHWDIPAKT